MSVIRAARLISMDRCTSLFPGASCGCSRDRRHQRVEPDYVRHCFFGFGTFGSSHCLMQSSRALVTSVAHCCHSSLHFLVHLFQVSVNSSYTPHTTLRHHHRVTAHTSAFHIQVATHLALHHRELAEGLNPVGSLRFGTRLET